MQQYKVFIIVIQVILTVQSAVCGFERTAQPTSSFSRAFSGIGMFAIENFWMNPASLGKAASFQTTLFYSPSPFQLDQLTNYGVVSSLNIEPITAALGIQSFGFSLYRETAASIGVASMLSDEFSAGINAHLYHLSIERYGTALSAVVDIGAIVLLTDHLNIGFSVNNISGSTFGSDDDIPQILMTGISFRLGENAVVNADVVKDVRYALWYRAGIEFSPHELVAVRVGTDGASSRLFGGIGIRIDPFIIHYGAATHSELGFTQSIGISFQQ